MRLIDADEIIKSIRESIDECVEWADKVEESEMYARVSQSIGTFVECSLRIKNAPTVDVLDKIRAEIEECLEAIKHIKAMPNEIEARKLTYEQCLGFIDKYKGVKE